MHSVNLLPAAATQRFQFKRIATAWSQIVIVVILATVGIIVWGQSTATRQGQRQQQQEALAQHPRHIHKRIQQLRAQIRHVNALEQQQIEQRSRYSPLVVIDMLHRLKSELGGELQVKSLDFVQDSAPTLAPSGAVGSGHVSLQLVSHGPTSCARIIQLIRDTGYFIDVNLSSSLEKVDANHDDLQFSLRCQF